MIDFLEQNFEINWSNIIKFQNNELLLKNIYDFLDKKCF